LLVKFQERKDKKNKGYLKINLCKRKSLPQLKLKQA